LLYKLPKHARIFTCQEAVVRVALIVVAFAVRKTKVALSIFIYISI